MSNKTGQKELDEYIFTRPEMAKMLGITTNALRMRMRKGRCNLEYRFDGKQFKFKRPPKDPVNTIKQDHIKTSRSSSKKKIYNRGNTHKGMGKYTNRAFELANQVKVLNTINKNLPKDYTDEINDEVITIAKERVAKRKENILNKTFPIKKNYGGLLNQNDVKAIEQREQSSLSRVSFTEDKRSDNPSLFTSSVCFGTFGQEAKEEKEGIEIDTRDFPTGNEEPEFRSKIEESIWRLKHKK